MLEARNVRTSKVDLVADLAGLQTFFLLLFVIIPPPLLKYGLHFLRQYKNVQSCKIWKKLVFSGNFIKMLKKIQFFGGWEVGRILNETVKTGVAVRQNIALSRRIWSKNYKISKTKNRLRICRKM